MLRAGSLFTFGGGAGDDMRAVKRFVLGSALVAMGGAQAADLPVKAKAVEYVKICSPYGAGFYYIPGTDTCIKLGGYLRVDVLANTNTDDTGNVFGQGAAKNRYTNGYTWRSREDLSIDTRTQTEYGTLRTLTFLTFTWNTDSYLGTGTGATVYSPIGPFPFGSSDHAGTIAPDIVASVDVQQAWGEAKLSAVAHDNHVAYHGATEPTGHPDDKWGWAAQLGFTFKNLPTGPGDVINISGVYT